MAQGIWYDPRVHDFGSQVVQGGLAGLAAANQMQQMDANKMKLDEAKRLKAVQGEIQAAYKEYEAEIKGTAPKGGMDETQKGMIATDQQGAVSAEGTPSMADSPAVAGYYEEKGKKPTGLAGLAAEKQVSVDEDQKAAPLHAKGSFMTKARDIFMKNGMMDKAQEIEKNYMSHVAHIGHYVSKKAALKELQSGMFKDSFEGVTEKDLEDNKDTWDVKNFGPNHDGIIKYNKKDGTITVVQEATAKEEKEDKESWAGFGYGQMKNLKTGEIVKVPTVPREGGGSKADAKKEWTKGDVRQEYNNLNGYLNKVESDLAKQIETEGESADLSEQLAKVRNIRKGLMKYRSDDEWSVSDENSSERGKYPRNLQKIADYLAGFGEQEKPNDITQMKPTAKGSATGKVRKPLDDIL